MINNIDKFTVVSKLIKEGSLNYTKKVSILKNGVVFK